MEAHFNWSPHLLPIRVRFGELDPYNHVNHAVYVAYLEAGRTEAMNDAGIAIHVLADLGWNLVITNLEMVFRKPAVAGDQLVVKTWITQLGAITGKWTQQIWRSDDLLIEGSVRVGSVDLSGRPKRMSPEIVDRFRPLLSAPL